MGGKIYHGWRGLLSKSIRNRAFMADMPLFILQITGMAFEGYKYTHAVVFGFDRRGRLIWDNSFEINDVTSYTLDQFVHVSLSDEEMALLYMYENEIRTKVIEG
jgi:hypothetical protein